MGLCQYFNAQQEKRCILNIEEKRNVNVSRFQGLSRATLNIEYKQKKKWQFSKSQCLAKDN